MAHNTLASDRNRAQTAENSLSSIFSRTCAVVLNKAYPKIACNDFVIVNVSDKARIAKVVEIFDNNKRAHVKWYIGLDELQQNVRPLDKSVGRLKFHATKELFEFPLAANIELGDVFGKCHVFYVRGHNLNDVLRSKEMLGKYRNEQVYVCRYKLVKKTVYTLMPVEWSCEEEEHQNRSGEFSTDEEDDDAEYRTINLSAEIDQLTLEYSSINEASESTAAMAAAEDTELRVTPIKISASGTVSKVKRNGITATPSSRKAKKRNDDDGDDEADRNEDDESISPSKRSRYEDEANQNYLTESPRSGRRHRVARDSYKHIRKNLLNESFNRTAEDIDDDESPAGTPANAISYTSKIVDSENSSVKMLLRKSRLPLMEQHDNVDSPNTSLRNRVLKQTMGTRSSLKPADGSAKSTARRSVAFSEQPKPSESADTSFVTTPRRSSRKSTLTTSAIIRATAEDESPDAVVTTRTPRSRRSVAKSSAPSTPKSRLSMVKTPSSTVRTPQQTRKMYRSGGLTPSIQARVAPVGNDQTELEMVRERLHVSAVPTSLPCRDKEFDNIYNFVIGKLMDGCGGCIYISGVPGTGKTATVTQVVNKIQSITKSRKMPAFDYIDINGMRLTEPRQAYVQIYRQLSGKTLAWAQARDLLESHFTDPKKRSARTTVLLVDELDIICNRKQDVVYNLFDWTARKGSRLIAITIANTMDLPERVLKLKVASRLGLTRITFQPYSFKQLQEVVMARLAGSKCFVSDAVQLVARKVASVSGDCRRALDICRRATEIAEEKSADPKDHVVCFAHVNQALTEMFASPRVRAIRSCTKYEKLFLQAVAAEIQRTGIEEVDFFGVLWQIAMLAPLLGINSAPEEDQAMQICMTLASSRLIIAEDSSAGLYQKIILNVSVDDLYYALNLNSAA